MIHSNSLGAFSFLICLLLIQPTIALADVVPPDVWDNCESDEATVYSGDRCRTAEIEYGRCELQACDEVDAGELDAGAQCLVCVPTAAWDDTGGESTACAVSGVTASAASATSLAFFSLFCVLAIRRLRK